MNKENEEKKHAKEAENAEKKPSNVPEEEKDVKEENGGEVSEERAKWEKEMEERIREERADAARLATMSSDERLREEIEKSQAELEKERAQYLSEKAEFEAAKKLEQESLPVVFAKMVADPNKTAMENNVKTFKTEFMKAVEEEISKRLKGGVPAVSKHKEQCGDPFLTGLGM